jgi:hypothetical protein
VNGCTIKKSMFNNVKQHGEFEKNNEQTAKPLTDRKKKV